MFFANRGGTRLPALLMLAVLAIVPPAAAQSRDAPEEMRAELEFTTPAGHFEMREYPPASKAILSSPSRVSAEVKIETANRDKQFSSTVGFWVFDKTQDQGIRLMLMDDPTSGKLVGKVDVISKKRAVNVASFKLDIGAKEKVRVDISRPTSYEVAYTVGGRTRTYKVDFDPASLVFQAVGVDGWVKFLDAPAS